MRIETIPVQLIGYEFKNQSISGSKIIEENKESSNDFFWKSNEYTEEDCIGRKLDLSSIIDVEDGYLKGNLSDSEDIDYYKFDITPYRTMNMVEKYNVNITIILDHIPEGCNYNIVLYDQNGNQVGIGEDNGSGGKSITIPNWDTNNKQYTVRVQAEYGSMADPNEYYHLSFVTTPADQENNAYKQIQEKQPLLAELRRKLHKDENYSEEMNALEAIDKKYESIYQDNLVSLHQQQAQELLGDKAVDGEKLAQELLSRMVNGEELTEEEYKILKIFTKAYVFDVVSAKLYLDKSAMEEIIVELEKEGIDISKEAFTIYIGANGGATVENIKDAEMKEKVETVINSKFSLDLLKAYITIEQPLQGISNEEKELSEAMLAVEQFLYKATGGKISLIDLTVEKNSEINGLPANIGAVINNPGNNLTYLDYRTDILAIKNYLKINGINALPECNAEFDVCNGSIRIKS